MHNLFAQLFVLRAVEDRELAPKIPRLESTLVSEQRVDTEHLRALFSHARNAIQSQLFADDPLDRFPDFVLAGIIRDLYVPVQLPRGSQRYNFAWIDADVLGRAYEKYLANVYMPAPPSPQLTLFDQPVREVEPVSVKRSGAIFYTPDYLVGTLTEQAIERVLAERPDPEFIPRIADFACGSGSFLVKAVGTLLRHLRERDPQRDWPHDLIEGKHVIGIDVDPRAVALTRMNLWIRLTDEPNALPLPSIEEVVVLGDSLGEEVWATLPESYDIVLGNPPFIATGKLRAREELVQRFQAARGRFDYSHLVHTDLLGLIDFGANEVFRETSAYIGAVIARKRLSPDGPRSARVRAVLVSDVSNTRYLGGLLVDALRSSGEFHRDALAAFDVAHPRGDQAWVLLSPSARRARMRLEENAVPLGDFAGIFQGIRTGANDLFIMRLDSTDGTLARVASRLGDLAILETAMLHPVVFGSDIQRYDLLHVDQVLLYPYRRGAVLSEAELQEAFPKTYAYLSAYRDLLSSRGSIVLQRRFL